MLVKVVPHLEFGKKRLSFCNSIRLMASVASSFIALGGCAHLCKYITINEHNFCYENVNEIWFKCEISKHLWRMLLLKYNDKSIWELSFVLAILEYRARIYQIISKRLRIRQISSVGRAAQSVALLLVIFVVINLKSARVQNSKRNQFFK